MARPKYWLKKTGSNTFVDIEVYYKGVYIEKVEGLLSIGETKNVTTQEWMESNTLDVHVPAEIYRKAVSVKIHFVVHNVGEDIDVKQVHDRFVSDMINGIISFQSDYVHESNTFINTKGYTPTADEIRLYNYNEGTSLISGTIELDKINSINTKV